VKRFAWIVLIVAAIAAPGRAASDVIKEVRAAIARSDFAAAESVLSQYRAEQGTTPEALEALSWLGRGALAAGDRDRAEAYARQTHQLALEALKQRPIDAETHLPIALGAAIEVQAQVLAGRNQRSEALTFLSQQLALYRGSSLRARIQKNIHLLSLEGQPLPALAAREFLGAPMPATKGRAVVLFFWAHWCPDCREDAPVLASLEAAYRSAGLVIIGPTQRYGYVKGGAPASPEQELAYIEQVRQQTYAPIANLAVPVSGEDFASFGVSTTPTIIVADRNGRVVLYHPGKMTRAELEPYVKKVVESAPTS
jgi:thiol-disulfide isomerase/thioredoxin